MDKLREKVRKLLKEGKVAGYVGYIMKDSHPLPHLSGAVAASIIDEKDMNRTAACLVQKRGDCLPDHVCFVSGGDDYGDLLRGLGWADRWRKHLAGTPEASPGEQEIEPDHDAE